MMQQGAWAGNAPRPQTGEPWPILPEPAPAVAPLEVPRMPPPAAPAYDNFSFAALAAEQSNAIGSAGFASNPASFPAAAVGGGDAAGGLPPPGGGLPPAPEYKPALAEAFGKTADTPHSFAADSARTFSAGVLNLP